jgi:rhodanese-related sulfurtransferase
MTTSKEYFRSIVPGPDGVSEIEVESLASQPPHTLIDVREAGEYHGEMGHIAGSTLIPLSYLEHTVASWDRDTPLIVMCRSGKRSLRGLQLLKNLGFKQVVNLRGGILAYRKQLQEAAEPAQQGA